MSVRPGYASVPAEAPLPYVGSGKLSLIAGIIVIIHAVIAVVPLVFTYFSDILEPPITVIRVPLVDHAPNEEPAPGAPSPHPSPLRAKPEGTPDFGQPLPPLPELPPEEPEPDPQPEVKEQPQPKPQPKVKPKPEVEVIRPSKTKVIKKIPPKEKTIKTSTKKVTKKIEQPKPAVRVSKTKTRVQKNPNAIQPARKIRVTRNPSSQAQGNPGDAQRRAEIGNMIRSMTGTPGGKGTAGGGAGGTNPHAKGTGGVVDREIMTYYDKVGGFLKSRWKRPHKDSLNGKNPTVEILLSVDAQGRVVSADIRRLSGISAMDESVRELLANCKVLPVPPKPMIFTVLMEIDP